MTGQSASPLPAVTLAWLAEIGITPDLLSHHRPRQAAGEAHNPAAATLKTLRKATQSLADRPSATLPQSVENPAPPTALSDSLAELSNQALACKACALHEQRHQLVFGAGDTVDVDWLAIGEAPGKEDDRLGLPFQGEAGALLVAMLASVGLCPESLDRKDVAVPHGLHPLRMYFTNLVKCRPLMTSSPQLDEVDACRGFLMKQIEIIKPRRLLLLGSLPAKTLLQTDLEVEALRQTLHSVETHSAGLIPALVTWHPAALLLRPQHKRQAWDDMRYLRELTATLAD